MNGLETKDIYGLCLDIFVLRIFSAKLCCTSRENNGVVMRIVKIGLLSVLVACGEQDKDAEIEFLEEPSSEPSSDSSDSSDGGNGSTDSSGGDSDGSGSGNGSDGGSGSGSGNDGNSDGDSDGSNGSVGTGTLNPDVLLFSFENGYIDEDVSPVTFDATGEGRSGFFRVILYDTLVEDYCSVDWVFDESTTAPDVEYADGSVFDTFTGLDMDVWYGFVVLSPPETSGSCVDLTADWTDFVNALLIDRPGFGYGPLTDDLTMSMESEGYADWDDISDYVFTGIPSLTSLTDGERAYFPVNQGYAHAVDGNGVTLYNSDSEEFIQGTELTTEEIPSADAYYVGNYYFGIGVGDH